MTLTLTDILTFVAFILLVVGVSLYASRREKSSEDYFLAGRNLSWWLIGFSLIASNISTEHFVGMAGSAFGRVGMAIASYEWMSAITLVIVAWWLLPKFLRIGIYTMPEFLEYRYDGATRTIMAIYLLVAYVVALLATVLYTGSRGIDGVFDFQQIFVQEFGMSKEAASSAALYAGIWAIGIVAAIYTVFGGLKAVVWSDLLQGGALLLGGAIVLYLGLLLVGGGTLDEGGGVLGGSLSEGWARFTEKNVDKLHVVLPWNDPDLPWLAVFVGGLWIPNLFYWGLNQFITQRTLGARNLAEGQKGIYLACFFKLLIPFIIVIPGIMAFDLFEEEIMAKATGSLSTVGEQAYPYLISRIMPPFLRGIMLAALAGAVMSTFNSGINSASTIYTIDLYKKYVRPDASTRQQVKIGRYATAIIAILACLLAPLPGSFKGVFAYIQEIWGFISPGIVAAFLGGILLPRAPVICGRTVLLLGPVLYAFARVPKWILESGREVKDGQLLIVKPGVEAIPVGGLEQTLYGFHGLSFLHHMAMIFLILMAIMFWFNSRNPLTEPVTYPQSDIDVRTDPSTYVYGTLIILATVALYILFW